MPWFVGALTYPLLIITFPACMHAYIHTNIHNVKRLKHFSAVLDCISLSAIAMKYCQNVGICNKRIKKHNFWQVIVCQPMSCRLSCMFAQHILAKIESIYHCRVIHRIDGKVGSNISLWNLEMCILYSDYLFRILIVGEVVLAAVSVNTCVTCAKINFAYTFSALLKFHLP